MELKYPKNFLWGAATSAHQVEGNNHNDWSEWEKENAQRLSKASGGKYPPENYISGRACDHYNRFRDYFARYVEKIIKSYPDVKYWLTFNEPTVYAGLGYIQGTQPPWVKSMRRGNTVFKNFVKAHRLAYQTIHKNNKNASVGFAHHLVYMVPKNNLPWNRLAVRILEY